MGLAMTGIDYFVDGGQVRETNILVSTEHRVISKTTRGARKHKAPEGMLHPVRLCDDLFLRFRREA